MIYHRSLMKELTLTAVGIFFILLIILISTQVINLLGRIAGGRIALDAMTTMLAVWVIGLTPILLILTAFISILTVFSRYWRDSEMVIWLSCGLSLRRWIIPLMTFVLPLTILTAVISLWASPWAEKRGEAFAQIIKQKQDISLIEEGIFRSLNSNTVYFVEHFDANEGIAKNIFVQHINPQTNQTAIISAKSGKIEYDDDKRILHLSNGYRYAKSAGTQNIEKVGFERADLIIAPHIKIVQLEQDRHMASIKELWNSTDPQWHAELMWRISMPLAVPILSLLALALSYYNPRNGRTYNIILAVLFFFIYQSGLTFMRARISSQHIDFWLGLLPVHIIMLIIAILWLYYRNDPIAFMRRGNKT